MREESGGPGGTLVLRPSFRGGAQRNKSSYFLTLRGVVLYVHQPGSMDCTQTEEFLRERGVGFTVINVAEDERAFAELERMGTTTTPLVVAGEEVIVGFDRERLEKLATGN